MYFFVFFFFNDTATTEIYTLSLHDALPISVWITASSDNGITYSVPVRTAAGDVGGGIAAGSGKHISWDAVSDIPGIHGNDYIVKLVFDDGHTDRGTAHGVSDITGAVSFYLSKINREIKFIITDSTENRIKDIDVSCIEYSDSMAAVYCSDSHKRFNDVFYRVDAGENYKPEYRIKLKHREQNLTELQRAITDISQSPNSLEFLNENRLNDEIFEMKISMMMNLLMYRSYWDAK